MLTHGEEPILNEMFKLLNDNLTTILAQQENNEQNLMYMFDIIFNLIKYTPSKYHHIDLGFAAGLIKWRSHERERGAIPRCRTGSYGTACHRTLSLV